MDYRGNDMYVLTSGLPEWGTQLGDGRYDVLSHPWIPFAPAVAFLIGVVAFNLLSQGLETVVFSVQEIKEATTARFSRRWRWALVPVAVAAVLWYYQGLPWGRGAEIQELAARQAAALAAGNLDAYEATLSEVGTGATADLRRWAAELVKDVDGVAIHPKEVLVYARTATATWEVAVGYKNRPTVELLRETRLVRKWGRWYEAGEEYRIVNGYDTDLWAVFDPVDPRVAAIPKRWNVQFLATTADHAYQSVQAMFPAKAGAPRPEIRLYPDSSTFAMAVGPRLPQGANVWYEPGEPIRVAPEYLKGYKRWDVQRSLALEMMKFLTETRLGRAKVSPLTLGTWELHLSNDLETYRIEVGRLAGQKLYSLPELFAAEVDELSERQALYAVQSGLLAEYAEAHLPDRPVIATDLADLSVRLGTTVEALSRDYYAYVMDRIYSESLLTLPAAVPRIPAGLADAVAARSQAVNAFSEAGLVAGVHLPNQLEQLAWLAKIQKAGVRRYEARFLDFTEVHDGLDVHLLEEAVLADGREVSGVVRQRWYLRDGIWKATVVSSLVP